jgi:septum formation protein
MKLTVPFLLASASPRRSHLLASTGFTFSVLPADIDETCLPDESPSDMVKRLSAEKALTLASSHVNHLVLGADTCVVLDGSVLGKPETEQEAREMLGRLSGRTHTVHTGFALAHRETNRLTSLVESTRVEFAALSTVEIDDYVATGSPMDKAGAYGIQDGGAFFVRRIEGDFYTVMGLPLHRLYTTLRSDFSDLLMMSPIKGD